MAGLLNVLWYGVVVWRFSFVPCHGRFGPTILAEDVLHLQLNDQVMLR